MSPKDCVHSSTVGRSSFASSPPALLSIMEQYSDHSGKLEVKDVEVDKRATMIRWSRKRGIRISKKGQADVDNIDFNDNALGVSALSLDVSEAAMDNSKYAYFDLLSLNSLESSALFLFSVQLNCGEIFSVVI